MAILEFNVIPIGTASTSVSGYVSGCHKLLKETDGIKYQLTPMGTIIEGDLDLLFGVVRRLHEVPFQQGAARVVTTLKLDDRRDRESSMEQKMASVRKKLADN